jgi:integrase
LAHVRSCYSPPPRFPYHPSLRPKQQNGKGWTHWIIRRRAADAGLKQKLGCHVFRATWIKAYLEADGTLENAQAMAVHEISRTTKLYDRTGDEITLGGVERIKI